MTFLPAPIDAPRRLSNNRQDRTCLLGKQWSAGPCSQSGIAGRNAIMGTVNLPIDDHALHGCILPNPAIFISETITSQSAKLSAKSNALSAYSASQIRTLASRSKKPLFDPFHRRAKGPMALSCVLRKISGESFPPVLAPFRIGK